MDRFKCLNEEERARLGAKATNENTSRSTNQWLKVFAEWANVRGKNQNLEQYVGNKRNLDHVLGCFYSEVRKKNGQDYEPDCLRVMQGSFQRHLNEKKTNINILTDPEFEDSRRILEGKARELRQMGMGKRPNASEALTRQEEDMLWEKGHLGRNSPEILMRTMWFINVQHFGLRGVQEHTYMRMD